ncbi:hypothetical protein V5N11_017460 [Cardamine amara subsp. amara]|uniref:Uncharacterized protein n=1 Tax=Cardamine amara subsp. amara TaxID=228776 RepID=A0ABD1ADH8_CARAN
MGYTVDVSCVMKVNRSCQLCRQKVAELMHCLTMVYSVDFVGADNTIKLKARADPYIFLDVIERYGEHGKVSNLRFDGEVMASRGGGYYGQSGYYLPTSTAGNYPYPYSYPPPPPYGYAGNCAYPMSNPPHHTEGPRRMNNPHTAPPHFTMPMPPPRPLHSFSYVEPPNWPTSSSGGKGCVIM